MNNTGNVSGRRFVGVIALIHLVFFVLACYYRRIFMGDSFEYVHEAVNIKDALFFYSGNPAMPIEAEYMSQRQPLYPIFLLSVYLFSVNNWVVLVLQNILSFVNIWYERKSLFILGYKEKWDKWLLVLIAAYPIQFIYANTIAPEILLQTFCLVYIRQMVLMIMHKKWSHAAWASVALILGLFVKPVLYPFVAVHLVLLVIWAVRNKMNILRAAGIGVLPLLAVLMYNSWNLERTGKFHFSSNQGFNALFYYYKYFAETEGPEKARAFLNEERATIATMPEFKDRYEYANERGTQLLKEHFGPYMKVHLKHSARMLIEPGKGQMDLFTGKLTYGNLYQAPTEGFYARMKREGIGGLPGYAKDNPSFFFAMVVLLFNFVRLVGLVAFFFSKKVLLPVRLFILMMLGYFLITTGPIANTHYFLPISLTAIGCAVIGIMNWRDRVRNTKLEA
jgi:hypothetical protein